MVSLVLVWIIGVANLPAFGEETVNEGITPKILFKATGDADDTSFANKIGTFYVEKDDEKGNVYRLESGSSYYALIAQSEPIISGNVVVSYDMKTTNTTAMTYMRSFKGFHKLMTESINDEMFESLLMMQNGRVGLPTNMKGFTQNTENVRIALREWQHYDIWFDMDNKVASLYVDGKFIVSEKMKEEFDKYCGYVLTATTNGGAATYHIDNIYIGHIPQNGYKVNFDFVQGVPSEVEDPVSCSLSIDPLGHIFRDKNVTIHSKIKNPYDEKKNITYNFKAESESGRIAFEETKTVEFGAKEEKTVDFNFDIEEYGIHYVTMTVKNDSGFEKAKTTRFSVFKRREDGLRNPRMGINSHYISGRGLNGMEQSIELFANIGSSYNREGFTWAHYEAQKGVYALYSDHRKMLDAINKNELQNVFILGHENLARNIKFPRTDEEHKAWCAYVENLVKDLAPYGAKYFEYWNEVAYPWNRGELEPIDYIRMVKETYPIVKKYIPDAVVMGWSFAGVDYTMPFIEACNEIENLSPYMDGIAYHTYTAMHRPEEGTLLTSLEKGKKLMAECGYGDKPFYLTEYGYTDATNFVNTLQQAQFNVRASALLFDEVPFTTWYVNIEKLDVTVEKEYHFGWIKGWRNQEINFEAKPVLIAMANWNAIMADAKSNGKLSIFDGGGHIYKFTNGKEDIYAVWKVRGDQELSLDLGVGEVKIIDLFGNERTQKNENGILRLNVNESMQYLIGNFPKCEEIKEEAFNTDKSEIEAIVQDTAYLTVNNNTGNNEYTVDVDLPDTVKLDGNTGFADGKCKLTFNVGIDARTGNTVKVNVKNKNGDIVWQKEIKLNINEAADIAFDVQYQKSGRWKGALKVTNNKNSKDLSGEFKISEPQIISEYTPVVKIENIPPNSTRIVEFSIPLEASRDFIELKGEVVFESGERKEINESSYFTALTPVRSTPKIDGVIEKGEYNAEAPMRFNKSRMAIMPADARWTWNWNGLNDLSAVGYINYDKEFFYLAYEVTDDILGDKDAKKRIWANDSVQFAFVNDRTPNNKSTEIGIGIVDGTPQMTRYSYLPELENVIFYEGVGKKEGFEDTTEFAVNRKGNKTTYEVKMSWIDIFGEKYFDKDNVYFAAIINENDLTDEGRLGWLEFSPGIGIEKSATLFTKVPVTK